MSRNDQVIDDDEPDSCPLCIEELDLSDRNFRPCPCGYQVCQFCYNNIKTTMNGLCPACRRPYDDKNIKFDAPTADDVARYKENQANRERRARAAKKQELASKQADSLSRKHLAGIRVRRQNLVYVTGLRLNTSDPQLSDKLRGEQFFGQYGKIDKIVVNRAKDSRALQPVGVYITYFEKDAAALCIAMVNDSQNAGGTIRADYGTTKYCSAFLRLETCTNKNCTFLHEVGDDNESFTREGLSSLNAHSSQETPDSSWDDPQPPPQQPPQPHHFPAISEAMQRSDSKDGGSSSADAEQSYSAWGKPPGLSRRASQAQTSTFDSPAVTAAVPATKAPEPEPQQESAPISASGSPAPQIVIPAAPKQQTYHYPTDIQSIKRALATATMDFEMDLSRLSEDEIKIIKNMPLLFDPNGGAIRAKAKQREIEQARLAKDQEVASQALSGMHLEDNAEGGSLQLGGEPDERADGEAGRRQTLPVGPPADLLSPTFSLAHALSPESQPPGLSGRSSIPQQPAARSQYVSQHDLKSPSPGFQSQSAQGPVNHGSHYGGNGHGRQNSRFSFANDIGNPGSSVKATSNPRFAQQQSAHLPSSSQYSSSGNHYFTSGVQGPPPGLKATGTPPVSGGGMFGQGHGFATAGLGYGANSTGPNSDMMRQLLDRNRGGSNGGGQTSEAARQIAAPLEPAMQDHEDPFVSTSDERFAAFPGGLFGPPGRRSTPTLPPGLLPNLKPRGQRLRRLFQAEPRSARDEAPSMPGLGVAPVSFDTSQTGEPTGITLADQVAQRIIPEPSPEVVPESASEPTPPLAKEPARELKAEPAKPPSIQQPQSSRVDPSRAEEANLDDTSFPALPTPSATQASKEKPAKVSSGSGKAQSKQSQAVKADRNKQHRSATESIVEAKKEKYNENIQPQDESIKPGRSGSKKAHPGKIDIGAATRSLEAQVSAATKTDVKIESPLPKSAVHSETTSASRPSTPAPSSTTPLKSKPQPRTIRITSTPKVEAPAFIGPPTPSSLAQQALHRASPATSRQTSRRPSIASTAVVETPAGEGISDDVSITTGTASRATSPPPPSTRVGSAPVRSKTKSQAKKDRQERAKAEDSITPEISNQAAPAEVAPVVGRQTKKTKSKKPTLVGQSKTTTPDVSRPHSPSPATDKRNVWVKSEEEVKPEEIPKPEAVKDEPEPSIEEVLAAASTDKPELASPAAIVKELQHSGEIDADFTKLFLEPLLRVTNGRPDPLTVDDIWSMATPKTLTSAEVAALNRGEAVRREGPNHKSSSRLMISPTKKCLPRLTKELEDRYLLLEKRVMDSRPPQKYTHLRRQAANTLATIDDMLRDMTAILTRPPKTTTRNPTPPSQRQPSKKTERTFSSNDSTKPQIQPPPQPSYAADALSYLNQFILPPLPSAPRPNPLKPQMTGAIPGGAVGLSSTAATPAAAPLQPPTGAAIPRTYTTGEPTYSVSGVYASGTTTVTTAASGAVTTSTNYTTRPVSPTNNLDIQKLIHGDFGKLTQSDIKKLRKEDIDRLSPQDISALAQNAANAAAAAVGDLRNLNLGGNLGNELNTLRSADFEKIQNLGSKALKGQALSTTDMASLRSLGIGGSGSTTTTSTNGTIVGTGPNANAEAIKTALANAVNGVVQAAAAVAHVSKEPGKKGVQPTQAPQIQAPPPPVPQPVPQPQAPVQGQKKAYNTTEEAKRALEASKEESKTLEKRMAGLVRKNRKVAGLGG